MRMLMMVRMPHEEFNQAVRDGTAEEKLGRILEASGAESVYFIERDGHRTAVMAVDLASPSDVPRLAEPWFLNFNADVEFHVAMTPQDLAKAGLDKLRETWA